MIGETLKSPMMNIPHFSTPKNTLVLINKIVYIFI
jgi:hypothetical protein